MSGSCQQLPDEPGDDDDHDDDDDDGGGIHKIRSILSKT